MGIRLNKVLEKLVMTNMPLLPKDIEEIKILKRQQQLLLKRSKPIPHVKI